VYLGDLTVSDRDVGNYNRGLTPEDRFDGLSEVGLSHSSDEAHESA
jgi:hypothetical protein